jgi:hypothetical protein
LGGGYIPIAFEKAREVGLVKTRTDEQKYPPGNKVPITSTKTQVAEKLREILKFPI